MTLKREIKDAYIENGSSVYIKTHGDAVYVDENETETLTQRLDNVKDSITEHSSQLEHIARGLDISRTLNHIDNGTFQLNDTNYTIPVNSEWIGLGGTTITGGTKYLTWKDKQYVILKNITFDHIVGLNITNCNYIYIENCRFTNCGKVGVYIENVKEVHIKNCSFTNIGDTAIGNELNYLGGAIYGKNCGKIIFENNYCENTKGLGAVQLVGLDEINVNHNQFI